MNGAISDSLAVLGRAFRQAVMEQDRTGRMLLTESERQLWAQCERACIEAGICFSCWANDRRRVRLGRWVPGNAGEHAGRACPDCEQFYPCGEQPEYAPDPWQGDSDPGL